MPRGSLCLYLAHTGEAVRANGPFSAAPPAAHAAALTPYAQPPGTDGSGKVPRVSVLHPGLLWEGPEGTIPGEAEHRGLGRRLAPRMPLQGGGSGDTVCDMGLPRTKGNGLCPAIPEPFWTSIAVKNRTTCPFWQGRRRACSLLAAAADSSAASPPQQPPPLSPRARASDGARS